MKFAKELDREAVPEWRAKYLNYKAGKKHVKAIARAIGRAKATPSLPRRTEATQQYTTPSSFFGIAQAFTPPWRPNNPRVGGPYESSPSWFGAGAGAARPGRSAADGDERSGLAPSPGSGMHYGSFGTSPPHASDGNDFEELPAPAMRIPSNISEHLPPSSPPASRFALPRRASTMAPGPSGHQSPSSFHLPRSSTVSTPRRRIPRFFSFTGSATAREESQKLDNGMQNLDYVRIAEREFFLFLDKELDKIETFYKQKEDQATERLAALRAQLHVMRNRRLAEMAEAKKKRELGRTSGQVDDKMGDQGQDGSRDWISPLRNRFLKPGPNSRALQKMARTPVMAGQRMDEGRDYVRVPQGGDVPYRTAKRKLKLALQEFYRSLELLKSYALLNRTAFRKLNKKYDKTVHARPLYRYMNEKVNKSWFVNSDILDGHIRTVEDLYARYFERGNRKVAAGKLRNLQKRPRDSSGSAFRSGLLIGVGAVFAVQGLVYGSELLAEDSDLAEQTSYVMQLYGGYLLALLLFALFTLDCWMWTKNKVNYPFIFEFDPRNYLDWRELAEFPSFFFALLGVFVWLNFSRLGNWEEMYLYYPVVLVCITLVVLFFPAPVLHHKARKWFLYSHYRLLLSGLYPVEFRDFFLGDMWCSLTYATCNIELFFCLYANGWEDPEECSSSHSRLLGFFGALPPIWRALQCIRRYYDTRHVFPHLVNCGKYAMTILTAVFLSLYRIEDGHTNLSLFITFAAVNAVYCSVWDLFMDFSLLQAGAKQKLLREITAIRPVWIYYFIMTVDPILRFSWVFYAIFTHDTQHSTIVSFLVSLAEVVRRGLWTLIRVENEHCSNVSQHKAARDHPLPYNLERLVRRASRGAAAPAAAAAEATALPGVSLTAPSPVAVAAGAGPGAGAGAASQTQPPTPAMLSPVSSPPRRRPRSETMPASAEMAPAAFSTAVMAEREEREGREEEEEEEEEGGGYLRRRRTDTLGTTRSILQAMAEAHTEDFEKRRGRRRPGVGDAGKGVEVEDEDEEEEEEEEEGENYEELGMQSESEDEVEEELRMRARMRGEEEEEREERDQ